MTDVLADETSKPPSRSGGDNASAFIMFMTICTRFTVSGPKYTLLLK